MLWVIQLVPSTVGAAGTSKAEFIAYTAQARTGQQAVDMHTSGCPTLQFQENVTCKRLSFCRQCQMQRMHNTN